MEPMDQQTKILIVDDEPEVLWVLEKRLANWGYQVVKAGGGRSAVRLAREEDPDLVILDIDMPEMDGGEVAAVLRESDETKDIPIIFLTCLFTQTEEKRDGKAAGRSIFMSKPYNPEDLQAEIERMLEPVS